MKKIVCLTLALVMVFAVSAVAMQPTDSTDSGPTGPSDHNHTTPSHSLVCDGGSI